MLNKVTVAGLIEGWGEPTASAVSGRHVLAIQDTSEINFKTTPQRRRGLGEIGKGVGRGVLVGSTGPLDHVLKFRPPLVFGAEHIDRVVTALAESFVS